MKLRYCFILIFVYLSFSERLSAKEEALWEIFPDAESIQEKTVSIKREEKKKIEALLGREDIPDTFTYYEVAPSGYAVIRNARGRYREFTFLTAVNAEGSIERVIILRYEEIFGRKIKDKKFLSRFKGKTIKSLSKTDMDAVTGATISGRALTEGVRDVLVYISVVILKGDI